MTNKEITLAQWQNATTEQRSQWLKDSVLVRQEDAAELDRIAFPAKHR